MKIITTEQREKENKRDCQSPTIALVGKVIEILSY